MQHGHGAYAANKQTSRDRRIGGIGRNKQVEHQGRRGEPLSSLFVPTRGRMRLGIGGHTSQDPLRIDDKRGQKWRGEGLWRFLQKEYIGIERDRRASRRRDNRDIWILGLSFSLSCPHLTHLRDSGNSCVNCFEDHVCFRSGPFPF